MNGLNMSNIALFVYLHYTHNKGRDIIDIDTKSKFGLGLTLHTLYYNQNNKYCTKLQGLPCTNG